MTEWEDDQSLVEVIQKAPEGDLRVFEQLVERYQGRVVANCRYITRDEAAAEDLAQEVFVKAYFGLRQFEGRSSLRQWLQSIKVNHCLNYLKKREARSAISIDEAAENAYSELAYRPLADERLEALSERERIGRVLAAMPASLRLPLILRDMDDFSYEEVSRSLGIGLSATKMRIKRARQDFRKRYEAESATTPGEVRV
jgi:RNA polymerase sigma-70 factor, ECF subfamily